MVIFLYSSDNFSGYPPTPNTPGSNPPGTAAGEYSAPPAALTAAAFVAAAATATATATATASMVALQEQQNQQQQMNMQMNMNMNNSYPHMQVQVSFYYLCGSIQSLLYFDIKKNGQHNSELQGSVIDIK